MGIKIYNNDAKWKLSLSLLCIAFGSASALVCLLFSVIISVPLCAISLLMLAAMSKRFGQRSAADTDALRFVSNILENWSDGASTVTIIERSLDNGFSFYGEAKASLSRYVHSGDACAFTEVSGGALGRIMEIIALRLDSGMDVRPELESMKSELQASYERRLKGVGISSNAAAVSNAGSVLFFPAFAGISLGIIRATSISGQQASLYASLTIVFAGYILITTAISSRQTGGMPLAMLAKISGLASLALLILKLTSTLQIGAI